VSGEISPFPVLTHVTRGLRGPKFLKTGLGLSLFSGPLVFPLRSPGADLSRLVGQHSDNRAFFFYHGSLPPPLFLGLIPSGVCLGSLSPSGFRESPVAD